MIVDIERPREGGAAINCSQIASRHLSASAAPVGEAGEDDAAFDAPAAVARSLGTASTEDPGSFACDTASACSGAFVGATDVSFASADEGSRCVGAVKCAFVGLLSS